MTEIDWASVPCKIWIKARSKAGYGQKSKDGKVRYVHRIAWEDTNGPIPDGLWVLHRCDVPSCYEPRHLFLGTGKDNARDMAIKKRQVFQRNPEKHPRGVRHHNSKITPDIVRAIRTSGLPQRVLARDYGLSQATVWSILKRETWKEVA